jgi:ACT domain-containing protein
MHYTPTRARARDREEDANMRVHADLRLKDVPGQLVKALEPISTSEGNIVGVVHHHDVVLAGRISVNVTFEVNSQKQLEHILAVWKERDVDVARLSSMFETFEFEYLIVGEIAPNELREITDGIESLEHLDAVDIRYSISPSTGEKAAMVYGKVKERSALARVDDFLRQLSMQAGFLLISGLGD